MKLSFILTIIFSTSFITNIYAQENEIQDSIVSNNTTYYTIGIIIAIAITIILVLKKNPRTGPRKFRT